MELLFNLLFLYSLQLGYYIDNSFMQSNDRTPFYADFQGQVKLEIVKDISLNVGGSIRTYMFKKTTDIYFQPVRDDYAIFISLQLKGIEFGFLHQCQHTDQFTSEYYNHTFWVGAYSEVYLKIKGECKLF